MLLKIFLIVQSSYHTLGLLTIYIFFSLVLNLLEKFFFCLLPSVSSVN